MRIAFSYRSGETGGPKPNYDGFIPRDRWSALTRDYSFGVSMTVLNFFCSLFSICVYFGPLIVNQKLKDYVFFENSLFITETVRLIPQRALGDKTDVFRGGMN